MIPLCKGHINICDSVLSSSVHPTKCDLQERQTSKVPILLQSLQAIFHFDQTIAKLT